jgi:hypothetical protein
VFKPWVEDSSITINECIENDKKYWKVQKICKDKTDYEEICNVLSQNYTNLKKLYINLMAGDQYPNIGWLEFSKFCEESGIIDKNCSLSMIDRAFIATNFEDDDIDDNPNRELCRYEFMEILIRIADFKYK